MTVRQYRALLVLGVSALASTWASASYAQTQTGSPASPDPEQASQLDEVVVTARRTQERSIDVPISVTALSGEALQQAGVTSARDLGQITPGLNFQANGAAAQPAIRGVSSAGSNPGDAANVAIYVDNVYLPFQQVGFLDLSSVSQVEVLKGPQGTLFGRNATGGAIVVRTLNPDFAPSGQLSTSYASFNRREIYGYATGALIDNVLAANLSVQYRKDDGFVEDFRSGADLAAADELFVRGKLLWEPSDVTQIQLVADYLEVSNISSFSPIALNGNTAARALPGFAAIIDQQRPFHTALSIVPENKARSGGGLSLEASTRAGPFTLSSTTAYREYDFLSVTDSDMSPALLAQSDLVYDVGTFTQEFLATASDLGRFSVVAGLFYMNDRNKVAIDSYSSTAASNYTTPVLLASVFNDVTTESFAAFSEVTLEAIDNLFVTVGLRYSKDNLSYDGAMTTVAGTTRVSPESSADNISPRISVRYALNPRLNVYGTYSRGFKAGVFSTTSLATTAVDPEFVDAYEIGLKGRLTSWARLEAAAFHYDYKDLQVQAFGAVSTVATLQNAASAKIDGLEASLNLAPIDGLSVKLGLAYTDASYEGFPSAQAFVPRGTGGNVSTTIDAKGKTMIRTPPYTVNLAANYQTPLFGGRLEVGGNIYRSGEIFYDVSNRIRQAPVTIANANLGWVPANEAWKISVFGNNITDATYLSSVLVSGTGDSANYARPASFGVRLDLFFGR